NTPYAITSPTRMARAASAGSDGVRGGSSPRIAEGASRIANNAARLCGRGAMTFLRVDQLPGGSLAQFPENGNQLLRLVVGVEPAGVRQHPHPRLADHVWLKPDHRLRSVERDAVGPDAEHCEEPRDVPLHLRPQLLAARDHLGVGQLVRRGARTPDHV